MSDIIYKVQQLTYAWETLPEGEFETEASALAAMAELERDLGWRDLRVVADYGTYRDVILYGLESEEEEE